MSHRFFKNCQMVDKALGIDTMTLHIVQENYRVCIWALASDSALKSAKR